MHPYSNYPLRISQAGWLLERKVGRILKDLQSKRLITLSGKTIMVLDDNQQKLLTTPQIIFDQKKV